jgi:signal transduction histidine kinase
MPMKLPPRLLSTIVHDLRTPLNVIFLSLQIIKQAIPGDDPELSSDLGVVTENVNQIKEMLSCIGEYGKLLDDRVRLTVGPCDPRWLMSGVLEGPDEESPAARLEIRDGCPPEVETDVARARLAIQMALANARAAAGSDPVRVVLGGSPDRLVIEVAVDRPPPSMVRPIALRPDLTERLFGAEADRRGLDLAIAARVSELFGGSARLEVDEGRGTRVVLDWPARLAV